MTYLLPEALRDIWTMPVAMRNDGEPWRDYARRLRELLALDGTVDGTTRVAAVQTALVTGRYVICAEATADAVLATLSPRVRH